MKKPDAKLKRFCEELDKILDYPKKDAYGGIDKGINWLSIRSDWYANLKKKYGVI